MNITIGQTVVIAAMDGAEETHGTVKDVDGENALVRTNDGGLEWIDQRLLNVYQRSRIEDQKGRH